jgi:hypothetical protein
MFYFIYLLLTFREIWQLYTSDSQATIEPLCQYRCYVLLDPRNSSRDRRVIPPLAVLGEQSYQLTSVWVLPVWNVASWSVVRCIVTLCGLGR